MCSNACHHVGVRISCACSTLLSLALDSHACVARTQQTRRNSATPPPETPITYARRARKAQPSLPSLGVWGCAAVLFTKHAERLRNEVVARRWRCTLHNTAYYSFLPVTSCECVCTCVSVNTRACVRTARSQTLYSGNLSARANVHNTQNFVLHSSCVLYSPSPAYNRPLRVSGMSRYLHLNNPPHQLLAHVLRVIYACI